MSVALLRRPFDADVHDRDEVALALMSEIRAELTLRGEPHPRVYLVRDGAIDTLDLHQVATTDPGAHVGATIAQLRGLVGVEHVFVAVQLHAETPEGEALHYALLGAIADDHAVWWVLPYTTDPQSGVGVPGDWSPTDPAVTGSAEILRDLVESPPGARPASVLQPRRPEPDIRAAFFEYPEGLVLPEDASAQAELAARVAADDLLSGRVSGTVVVKQAGRHGEMWLLVDAGDLDDAVRSIALREPVAEGIAVVLLALWEGSAPPQKGVQIVAERAGRRSERWLLLDFPDGPQGAARVGRVMERSLAVEDDDGWLGVEPTTPMDFYPLGGDA